LAPELSALVGPPEYLARGFDVVATDPAPNAESSLRKLIEEAWKT
jgi:hypothetical protein